MQRRSSRIQLAEALCYGLLLSAPTACDSPPATEALPNIVLVSIDTLRADALSPYGGLAPSPTLDRLAQEGVLFEHAFAPAAETAPSHASLFTGQEVRRHGVAKNGAPLPEEAETLAEALRGRGYHTAGFVSSFVLDPRFGWDQGFQVYDARFEAADAKLKRELAHPREFWTQADSAAGLDRRGDATTRAARDWLASAQEPFFLFVHYFDLHMPYDPPPDYVRRVPGSFDLSRRRVPGIPPVLLHRLVRNYHGAVTFVDDAVGDLLLAAERRESPRPTLVVFTADHGEGLGQHDWLEHAVHLYEEQLHVPLVLGWSPPRGPTGLRIQAQVGLADLAPTILDLCGLEPLPDANGRSLAPSVRSGSEPEEHPLVGHVRSFEPPLNGQRGAKLSVRVPRWKYIRAAHDPDELYDLDADPEETRNVLASHGQKEAELAGILDAYLAEMPAPRPAPPLTDEERRALEALGYVP